MAPDLPFLLVRACLALLGIFLAGKILRNFFNLQVTLITLALVFLGTQVTGMIFLPGPPTHLLILDVYLLLLLGSMMGEKRWIWLPLAVMILAALVTGFTVRFVPAFSQPGSWVFYGNRRADPGSLNPVNLHRVLFSLQNGWLVYTPMALAALAGLSFPGRKNIPFFYTAFLFVVILLLFAGSDIDRQFPGRLSFPPMTASWAVLCVTLGYGVQKVLEKPMPVRMLLLAVAGALVVLNLFQTWQVSRSVLVPGRMTASYYRAVFGRISPDSSDRRLLKPISAGLSDTLPGDTRIPCRRLAFYDFEPAPGRNDPSRPAKAARTGKAGMVLNAEFQYSPGLSLPVSQLDAGDSAWIVATGYIFFSCPNRELKASLVITCLHNGKPYKYRVTDLANPPCAPGRWNRVTMSYRLASQAEPGDLLQVYFMNYGREEMFLDDMEIKLCKPAP
ncbi:MAG TPA: hypothetical protein PKG48_06375 [Bacteroidales bacterium]|nr:hypothetical protein [Bacteroidales bacterium]HPS63491.1 hypothetical protein [Bacteroidales bacterium]